LVPKGQVGSLAKTQTRDETYGTVTMMVDPPAAIGLEALVQTAVDKLMTAHLVILRILPLKALSVLAEKPEVPGGLEG
jgi:hypothetical protein